jgi:hypothetical protein
MMSETCDVSDSGLPRRKCWCAECRDERREARRERRKGTKVLSVRPLDEEETVWEVTVDRLPLHLR